MRARLSTEWRMRGLPRRGGFFVGPGPWMLKWERCGGSAAKKEILIPRKSAVVTSLLQSPSSSMCPFRPRRIFSSPSSSMYPSSSRRIREGRRDTSAMNPGALWSGERGSATNLELGVRSGLGSVGGDVDLIWGLGFPSPDPSRGMGRRDDGRRPVGFWTARLRPRKHPTPPILVHLGQFTAARSTRMHRPEKKSGPR